MEGGEPDVKTLMELLKEKAKDLKQTKKKLTKVEDKFVEFHKQRDNLVRDRETLISFLGSVFPRGLLQDEILTMPEGPDGFGMLDLNHLNEFWVMTKKNQENEHLVIVESLQEQKKMLAQRIQDYESNQNQSERVQTEIQDQVHSLEEENQALQEKVLDLTTKIDCQHLTSPDPVQEEKYLAVIEDLKAELKQAAKEASEMKAKQLMNSFQGQGL
mmetsp:Transcript_40661/g.62004  ORF Transcript_40661/g.62004 Transcript_40661/m.62004 type:complete len:215 (+) Transcript_40661:16-660(+)